MTIREQYEERERLFLAPQAALSAESRGREHPIDDDDIRTVFQRDRDRILHCKSFRRLKHKTQVFISPEGDHYRTRLTHTLEVSQIARTIARALRLNEDLTEAIALGHDLGHTPFGHTGERLLNSLSSNGFKHNLHSLRVVEVLEGGTGLNLTWEVRDGIANHTKSGRPATLEGQIVSLSDRIAYINHDIDDALRARIITAEELPRDCIALLGDRQSSRIDAMIRDVIAASQDLTSIRMSDPIAEATEALRDFMFDRVYVDSKAKSEEKKAMHVLQEIFQYFMEHPEELPPEYRKNIGLYGEEQAVCDYIAGMTDRYAMKVFERLFIPGAWQL
jgi:dGTPase